MSLEDLLKLATWALAIPAAVTAFLQWRRTRVVGRTTAAVERVRTSEEATMILNVCTEKA